MDFRHELVMPDEDLPFRLFRYEGMAGNYQVTKHWHRSVEIFAVVDGALDFYINSRRFPLCAGDLIIVNPSEIHSVQSPEPNFTLVLQIPAQAFRGYLDDGRFAGFAMGKWAGAGHSPGLVEGGTRAEGFESGKWAGAGQGLGKVDYGEVVVGGETGKWGAPPDDGGDGGRCPNPAGTHVAAARLYALIERMYRVNEEKSYGYDLEIRGLFYELLHLLVTRFGEVSGGRGEKSAQSQLDRLSHVTQYMKEHYREELPLHDVAARFGFTETYLSRVFVKYAQVNYRTYLIDLRVEHAVREMLNSERTLSELAIDHGFPDARAFAKAFRSKYGCLPSAYRKEMRG
ncbi:MAG: AraC family transcriptional regulator [Lachnospiraceae bacterium]|jgi:AraC-like DNA-binding protein/mannose-6-phosphate isomerase-like protein (cupin superfamily)|nr:AraC family transcriptional regulator [Lachnospiraceae bacterium]